MTKKPVNDATEKYEPEGPCGEARPRGRPRNPEVRSRIMQAARTHFLESGFEGASLERIAESAGTSKVTLYSHFPSKEALFNVVATENRVILFNLDTGSLPVEDPYESLLKLARRYEAMVLDAGAIENLRFISGHVVKNPALGVSFYETGPENVLKGVSGYLSRLQLAGTLVIENVDDAAEQFLGLVKGQEFMRMALGLPVSSSKRRDRYIKSSVRMFLNAYRK
jgi:TetR/AcrR family transcriptional repressor of mexJK operon